MTPPHNHTRRLTAIDLPVPAMRAAAGDDPWSRGTLLLPRVSVIVSCYNYAKYIEAALDSVAGQSYREFECVVVDDASTDDSVEIVENWLGRVADPRFRLIAKRSNGGQLSALADGLAATAGEFVAMLDADDLWLPEFLTRHVQAHLNSLAAFPASCSDLIQIDRHGHVLAGNTWWRQHFGKSERHRRSSVAAAEMPRLDPHGAVWPAMEPGEVKILAPDLFRWHWTVTSGMMFRRSMVDLIMPRNPLQVPICADQYLMTLAHYFSGSLILPEALAAYRRHGDNSFSNLPMLGAWGALTPGNGQVITAHNFAAMLDHVLDRYDSFALSFGRRRVRKFCRSVKCYLAAETVRMTVMRIVASLRTTRSDLKPEFHREAPRHAPTAGLGHDD